MPPQLALLEPYRPGGSWLHRAEPRVKLVLALAFIVAVTATPPGAWPVYLLLAGVEWAIILSSHLPVAMVLRRSLVAVPFMLIALPSVFARGGEPLATLSLAGWTLTATDEGLVFFLSVMVKSWVAVIAAGTLAATTPFSELLRAMRFLRLPRVLVGLVSFMYRYLFVLVHEAVRLHHAREARSARLQRGSGGSLSWRAGVVGRMAGSLFLRTYERSERVYQAMLARGYNGELVAPWEKPLSLAQAAVMAGGVLLLATLAVVAYVVW